MEYYLQKPLKYLTLFVLEVLKKLKLPRSLENLSCQILLVVRVPTVVLTFVIEAKVAAGDKEVKEVPKSYTN